MRLEQLEYLTVVAKSQSLSEAAKRLYITQQSLGKQISNLESELGVPLLIRTHNGCYLTKEGNEVLGEANAILDRVNNLRRRFTLCPDTAGDLTVLSCPSVHETILPSVINDFTKIMPKVNVVVIKKDSYLMPPMHQRLSSCGDNAVISIINVPTDTSIIKSRITDEMVFKPLVEDYWVACLNSEHPLANQASISLKQIFRETMALEYPDYPEIGIDHMVIDAYHDYGTPRIGKVFDHESLLYSAIENDNYVSWASHFFSSRFKNLDRYPHVVFREFSPTIRTQIGYITDKKMKDNQMVAAFTRCLEDRLASAGARI